ncbi:hypothetical protein [Azospirillum sp.]|nr:hypothetical protein [Azospirillum sp.]HYD67233.1 hypothetical protein [Azospirillum sp.]
MTGIKEALLLRDRLSPTIEAAEVIVGSMDDDAAERNAPTCLIT